MPAVNPLVLRTPSRRTLSPACLPSMQGCAAVAACTSVLLLLFSTAVSAGQANLTWDANTESNLAGYKVYVGNTSRVYQSSIDVGLSTSYTVTGLQEGRVYYFAVTAVSSSGGESAFSAEVSAAIPDAVPPVITAVTAAGTSSGATINWSTNEPSNSQVDFGLTTAYGSATPLNAALVVSHQSTLGGLAGGTLYHFRVRSKDAAGNLAVSPDFTFRTLDGTPPSVTITAPTAGATVRDTVTLTASASDDVAVAGVQFKLDGAPIGTERTAAPYTIAWNTAAVPNGTHALTASARDSAGNVKTSAAVTVTVNNDSTPPAVAIIAPISGVTVSGTIVLDANASDNVGIAGVRFAVDGRAIGSELTVAPYTMQWDTLDVSDGAHTVTAVARDAAGNTKTSAGINVTVRNGGVRLAPQDTSLNVNDINYSADTMLTTYTWPAKHVANAILMKFDLAAIPSGAIVHAATLHLALLESDSGPESTYAVTAHKLVGINPVIARTTGYTADVGKSWTPSPCCYNGIPLAQSDISAPYDTRAINKTVGDKTWTITGMVQDWVAAPSTNFGLLLNSDVMAQADRYRYFASAEHPEASLRPFLQITYSTAPAVDTLAPSVSITTPAANATLSGTTTIGAGATDNVGVAAVQFTLDGAALGAERTAAPYTVSWNTAGANDGPHTLAAIARDAAGNRTTSALVRVTVVNGVMRLTPADTSLNVNTTNYSEQAQLTTYTWPDNQRANAIIMKFDLSTLPRGAVVQEAILRLNLVESDSAPEGFYTVSAHKIVGVNPVIDKATGYTADGSTAWTASACCANDTPLAQGDITPAYDVRAVDKIPGAKTWTITSMAREWQADPSANFGILLNADASALANRYRYFASMEHANAALRPVLTIRYTLPLAARNAWEDGPAASDLTTASRAFEIVDPVLGRADEPAERSAFLIARPSK